MAIPSSDNYEFTEEIRVDVGDPTEAAAYANAVAGNTDYLKEAKVWGFDGNSEDGNVRASNKMGTGCFHVVREINEQTGDPVIVLNASNGLPDDDDGLKFRMITLQARLIVMNDASSINPEDFLPGETYDDSLASTKSMPTSNEHNTTFSIDYLYSGPGVDITDVTTHDGSYQMKFSNTFTEGVVDIHFWVKQTDSGDGGVGNAGDLMCVAYDNSSAFSGFLLILQAQYGPKWEEL